MTIEGNQNERVLALAKRKGMLTSADLHREDLPREYLSRLAKSGQLTQLAPGVYMDPEADLGEHLELAVVAARVPRAVFFGLTALVFHELTSQVAHSVEFAIERDTWTPKLDWPVVDIVHLSGAAFTQGVEEHVLEHGTVIHVYSVAKTVADLFKFRSRFGLDVALEALREGWRHRYFTLHELDAYAKICRVQGVMRPYMEMLS